MKAQFVQQKLTDFERQKGCNITIKSEDTETLFNIWCDTLEADQTTIRVTENNDGELLIVTASNVDFKLPTVSYSDDKTFCYITFYNNSVHIKLNEEGIVFDVWDSTDEENGSIESTYLYYGELEVKEAEEDEEVNHISIYGFVTESNLEANQDTHIDSIEQSGEWEKCVLSIIKENKDNYHHITVQSDDGKPLPSFQ